MSNVDFAPTLLDLAGIDYEADQLYNLSDDPGEQKNLARDPAHAEKLAAMKAELRKHLAGLPGTFGELKP